MKCNVPPPVISTSMTPSGRHPSTPLENEVWIIAAAAADHYADMVDLSNMQCSCARARLRKHCAHIAPPVSTQMLCGADAEDDHPLAGNVEHGMDTIRDAQPVAASSRFMRCPCTGKQTVAVGLTNLPHRCSNVAWFETCDEYFAHVELVGTHSALAWCHSPYHADELCRFVSRKLSQVCCVGMMLQSQIDRFTSAEVAADRAGEPACTKDEKSRKASKGKRRTPKKRR